MTGAMQSRRRPKWYRAGSGTPPEFTLASDGNATEVRTLHTLMQRHAHRRGRQMARLELPPTNAYRRVGRRNDRRLRFDSDETSEFGRAQLDDRFAGIGPR